MTQILLASAAVMAFVALLVTPARAAFPGDNGKIAFYSPVSEFNNEIYIIDPSGSSLTRLTNNDTDDTAPAWSADGKRLAWSTSLGSPSDIFGMNANGSNQAKLGLNSASEDLEPAWSPEGTSAVFRSNRDGNDDIYRADLAGTSVTRLTSDPSPDVAPAWSPNGESIAFSSFRDGNYELYVMNADGTGQTRLTNTPAWELDPDWSPDGDQLTFWVDDLNGGSDIYTMGTDGSARTNITDTASFSERTPAWSPDGKKIVFTGIPSGSSTEPFGVYVMNADGSDREFVVSGFAGDWQPAAHEQSRSKNAAKLCKNQRKEIGERAFAKRYGTNGKGSNAFGKCVSSQARHAKAPRR